MKKLILLILILPLGYCVAVAGLAQSKAENICSGIPANATVAAAAKVISEAGIPERKPEDMSLHDMLSNPYAYRETDLMIVVVPSVLGERWVCSVNFEQGHVSEKEVRLID